MGVFTFKGGVHPYDGKDLSMDKPIEELVPQGDMVYPLSQHIGGPAKELVKKGDRVLRGQLIAEASGFVSANIHSSVSGTVKAVEPRRTSNGNMVMSIVIENDQQYEAVDFEKNIKPVENLTAEDIRGLIKDAGIVGMGGAGFPTHVKMTPKNDEAIEYVLVNGAECEPYLTSDYRRMIEEPEKLIQGLEVVLKLFPNAKGIIAIEDNKPVVIKDMKKRLKGHERIVVNAMKTKYPQGAERQLIYANTKRKLNSKMLPADAGCVVSNVDTIIAIYEAVHHGKPLMERIVTVTGNAIANPCNFKVPLGTNCQELIQAAGGWKDDKEAEKIIAGGPMMGKDMISLDVPSVKGLSAILCLQENVVAESVPSNCIRCGKCSEVCPSKLMPAKLATLSQRGDMEGFQACDGMECVECGCCSYICPAKRHLTQSIGSARKQVLASRKK